MSVGMTFTAENFESEVEKSKIPVLIDFWAEWCMPCRMIAPHVEEIAKTYQGRLKVGSIDVDSEADLAARFGIISIPTLIVFKEGQVYRQKSGAAPKHEIENLFKGLI